MFIKKCEANAELGILRAALTARLDEMSAQNAKLERSLSDARKEMATLAASCPSSASTENNVDLSELTARFDRIETALQEGRKVAEQVESTTEAIANALGDEIDSINSSLARMERSQLELAARFDALVAALNGAVDAQEASNISENTDASV